ncbi:MAG: YceI family protein [Bacteroidota bacterium]
MKKLLNSMFRLMAGLMLTALVIPVIPATAQTSYTINSNSTMIIDGTSNVHDWECDVEKLNGAVEMNEGMISNVTLSIPVKSIDSGKGGMNSNMYDALKADKHKNITFDLESTQLKSGDFESDMVLAVTGKLTIAGKTQSITMDVNGQKSENGYTFSGEKTINMTDYDVKPPTAMFGTISTGEEVTIIFTINAEPSASS